MEASTSTASEVKRFKIVLLGEGAVGKTSIMLRYIENKFNPKHLSTLQASFMTKKLNIAGRRVELNIWDTAGQERFHALGPIYYRDSQGALLIYDVTDEDSYQRVQNWVKELRKMLGDNVVLMLVGNKTDLVKNRCIQASTASSYAQSVGASYQETSAKQNQGIEELFLELTKKMLERASTEQATNRGPNIRSRNVLVAPDTPPDAQSQNQVNKKCCA